MKKTTISLVETILGSRRNRAARAASRAKTAPAVFPIKIARARKAAKTTKAATLDFKPTAFLAKNGIGRTILGLNKGDHVFTQGTPANAIFYVQQGKIKISVLSKAGREATIGLLGAGNFLGEDSITAPKMQRVSTAIAIEPSSVLRIERAEMIRVLREERAFSEVFVTHLLARNARVQEDLVDQLFNSSEKRLARALLLLAHFGKDGKKPETVIPRISQEALAEMVGTTRSRVNFFMNRFREMGFIEYNGHLTIHTSLLNVILHD